MKVLVSDNLSPLGVEIFEKAPGIEVDVKTGLDPEELKSIIGEYDGPINLNSEEAEDYKWIDMDSLKRDIKNNPGNYTVWFKIAFEEVVKKIA